MADRGKGFKDKGSFKKGGFKGKGFKTDERFRDQEGFKGNDKFNKKGFKDKGMEFIEEREESGPYIESLAPGKQKLGWLINMQPTTWTDPETSIEKTALDMYFIEEDGNNFRVVMPFSPYFYIAIKEGHQPEVENFLRRKYEQHISKLETITKEDLDLKNHLSGLTRVFLKISFLTVKSLMHVRGELMPIVKKNRERLDATEAYEEVNINVTFASDKRANPSEYIIDIREYDVIYYTRVSIDLGIRVGMWYLVSAELGGEVKLEVQTNKLGRPEPRILAFDIETTKMPLKFPDASIDSIMMISYMLDKQGYLLVNREIISEDIDNFDYTPKPEFEGSFTITNSPTEKAMLEHFFDHIKSAKPNIFVTFNGDFFDWPFVEARAKHHKISMYKEIGIKVRGKDKNGIRYSGCFASHLDAFAWVKRDSYLPQGGQGLKNVTKEKLGYEPLELDPEKMVAFASEDPQRLAQYSVSDAVATWYLYMMYVHPFIFSLCNVIPMNPDDVLRKGSGTLCEALLMTEAFQANVVFPNKHGNSVGKQYKGHMLESETYVGGHVESLESGVFRHDLDLNFSLDVPTLESLISEVDETMKQAAEEGGLNVDEIQNYEEVKADILKKLNALLAKPVRAEMPKIYHVDVAAMYPNIILTNRLQPSAIVDAEDCAACDFNKPENRWYVHHLRNSTKSLQKSKAVCIPRAGCF